MITKRIEVPGVSKEPLNPNVVRIKAFTNCLLTDMEIAQGRRCQEWTREVVEVLITKGVLDESSRKHWTTSNLKKLS
jgi:hypothetical protein